MDRDSGITLPRQWYFSKALFESAGVDGNILEKLTGSGFFSKGLAGYLEKVVNNIKAVEIIHYLKSSLAEGG